jgi:hypothetical protein
MVVGGSHFSLGPLGDIIQEVRRWRPGVRKPPFSTALGAAKKKMSRRRHSKVDRDDYVFFIFCLNLKAGIK